MSGAAKLPAAQQRLFEKLGRDFDNREYSKALRSAESILSVVPDHCETMAMKGLVLYFLEKKEEGYEFINKAIAIDITSAVPWHTLGLALRADKKYPEALKALKRAQINDPTNVTILRDLSSICVQLRDWDAFLDTRQKALGQKATVRANWIALACGHKMQGNSELAAAVMDVMTSIMDAGDNKMEVSEVHLFRAELEMECNAPAKALEVLKKHDSDIVDEHTKMQLRAKAYAAMGQKEKAEKQYLELIAAGVSEADSIAAIAALLKIPLDEYKFPKKDVDKFVGLLNRVVEACPKCDYAKRHALDCVPIEEFRERLVAYTSPFITRMIPSLFSVLKSLYAFPERAEIIGEVFVAWEKQLQDGDFSAFGDGSPSPCYILWVWCFLSSHYRRLKDYSKAHEYINKAIAHTPTVELLYLMQAKIFAHEGKDKEAAEAADVARVLDLQDKYLNSKAAKYMFRANDVKKGEELMQLFYKACVVPNDTFLTALESQCTWYECEVGDAFFRMGDYLSALQNYLMYEKHQSDNHVEGLDFHNYVFRRCTMRPWFDFLAYHDKRNSNKLFYKFCLRLAKTYMKIAELGEEKVRENHVPRPPLEKSGNAEEDTRLEQLWKDLYLENTPIGEPLKKADHYVTLLVNEYGSHPESHVVAIDYYTTIQKPLLVVRSLNALAKVNYPRVQELADSFEKGLLASTSATMDARVKAVIGDVMKSIKK